MFDDNPWEGWRYRHWENKTDDGSAIFVGRSVRDSMRFVLRECKGLTIDKKKSDATNAQELYFKLLETKVKSSTYFQRELLGSIAEAAEPATVPFWRSLLGLMRSRDRFSKIRRQYALGALTIIVLRTGDADARDALISGLGHESPDTRADAAYQIGELYRRKGWKMPEEIQTLLIRRVETETVFAPRYCAGMALAVSNIALPLEYPNGVYAFKVRHTSNSAYRVIEIRSTQTLGLLHREIQYAWDWDDDHLYSFYLDGIKGNQRYEYAHEFSRDAENCAEDARVGELFLMPRHKFLYLFDYGDKQRFHVTVTAIKENADDGYYPRVVREEGGTLPQYPEN